MAADGPIIKHTNGAIRKKLLSYGAYNYDYETYWQEPHTSKILVTDGVENMQNIGEKVYLRGKCSVTSEDREKEILLKKGEAVTCKTEIPQKVSDPGSERGETGTYRLLIWMEN